MRIAPILRCVPILLVALAISGCMSIAIDPKLPVIPKEQWPPKPAEPMRVKLDYAYIENGKTKTTGKGSSKSYLNKSGYFKVDDKAADTLSLTITDNFDKGLNSKAFLVGLTWGIYSVGSPVEEEVVVRLTRAGQPAFERKYTGTHWINMGWAHKIPPGMKKESMFTAGRDLGDRMFGDFLIGLDGGQRATGAATYHPSHAPSPPAPAPYAQPARPAQPPAPSTPPAQPALPINPGPYIPPPPPTPR